MNILNYDRNTFKNGFYKKAMELGFRQSNKQFITFGEREPDHKVLEAIKCGFNVSVVEIFGPNIDKMKKSHPQLEYTHSSIQDFAKTNTNDYDIIWWFHGCEHITKPEAKEVLKQLIPKCKMIIMSCPHGKYIQGKIGNNEYEEHIAHYYTDDFKWLSGEANYWLFTESGPNTGSSMDIFIEGELK